HSLRTARHPPPLELAGGLLRAGGRGGAGRPPDTPGRARDPRSDRRVLAALDWSAPVDARGRRPVGLAPPRLRGAPRPPPRPPPAFGAQLRNRVRVAD